MSVTAGKARNAGDPNAPWPIQCACEPSRPDYFDAGCPFHGLKTQCDEPEDFVDHSISTNRRNVKWNN